MEIFIVILKTINPYKEKWLFVFMVDRKEIDYVNGGYVGGVDESFAKRYVVFYPDEVMGVVSRLIEKGEMTYFLNLHKSIEGEWRRVENFRGIPKESKLGKELRKLEEEGVFKK